MIRRLFLGGAVACVVGALAAGPATAVVNSGRPLPAGYAIGVVTAAESVLAVPPVSRVDQEVDWDSGWGPAEKASGLPNPRGWYRALMGAAPKSKVLYLTFDDGPVPGNTPKLLDLLAKYDAQATFFVLGPAAAGQPEVIARMAAEGHAVANHTWDHPQLTALSERAVAGQLRRTIKATRVSQGAGSRAVMGGCMRPPYGLIDRSVARVARAQGLQPVLWTGHIEDWNPHPVDWYVKRLRAATKPGAIILMHDTHAGTVQAVSRMLPVWRKQGYDLRAIPRCLAGR